jgi:hypothetical protein
LPDFQAKNPNLGKKNWVLQMEDIGIFYGSLVYLRPFVIFYGHLVYFYRFGILHQEKSGNPGNIDWSVVFD